MRGLVIAAGVISGVQAGAALVASRLVVGQTDPFTLALLRYAISLAVLLPLALRRPWPRVPRRHWLPLIALGAAQFALMTVLLNLAVSLAPSARVSLIFATAPMITYLMSLALGHESLLRDRALGVAACLGGVALVLGERVGAGSIWGDLAAVAAAVVLAGCNVTFRPMLGRYPALPLGVMAMAAGVATLLPISLGNGGIAALPALDLVGWLLVAGLGTTSALSFQAWIWAIGQVGATRIALFLSLGPITAMALGWAWAGEPVTTLFLAGLALVLAGLWLAYRRV